MRGRPGAREKGDGRAAAAIDILGLGAVAVDDLLFLEEFPKPDGKYRVIRRERHPGGLTGTALVAASRLGSRCAYAGTLGSDELSTFILESLSAEGVSVEHVVRQEGALPFRSTIVEDMRGKTRTILWDASESVGAHDSLPDERLIRGAGVLFVDHVGPAGMLRAARIARRAAIPVVADFEVRHPAPFDELLALADHLILSRDFACELTGTSDARAAAEALWTGVSRAAVVVTMGSEGAWFLSNELPGTACLQPAFAVDAMDTNGCGDVFHGAYASCLVRGLPMSQRVRFAAAAAAIKATSVGGQKGIPARAEVEQFLGAQGRSS
jgi:sugar/nucleoside kinase (ribokinase family)